MRWAWTGIRGIHESQKDKEQEDMRKTYGLISALALAVFAVSASADVGEGGLVGYWPLNGDANDASGNGHDGTLVGGAVLIDTDGAPVPGDVGSVMLPKEAGNGIDCGGGSDLQIASNLTLMAWANPTDSAPTQFVAGVPYDDGEEWDEPWVGVQIGVRGNAMASWINLIDAEGNAKDREYDSGATAGGEWQHLAFTFDGDIAISYVNGVEVAANDDRDGMVGYEGDPHFTIGERSFPALGEPFGGMIDEVALFSRVLSAAEVADAMANGVATGATAVEPAGKLSTTWAWLKR